MSLKAWNNLPRSGNGTRTAGRAFFHYGQTPEPTVRRRTSGKQRKLSLEEYRNTFMRPYRIEDRKPVFISRKLRDTLDCFACKIGENRISLSGLLENIVRHHVELYTEDFEFWKRL